MVHRSHITRRVQRRSWRPPHPHSTPYGTQVSQYKAGQGPNFGGLPPALRVGANRLFEPPDVFHRPSESDGLSCTSRKLTQAICCRSDGWWYGSQVSQYKAGQASLVAQGKRRYDRKQRGFGGQTKPIFHKKAKVTKKTTLRLTCGECKSVWQRCIGRTKSFVRPPFFLSVYIYIHVYVYIYIYVYILLSSSYNYCLAALHRAHQVLRKTVPPLSGNDCYYC
ncbi:ribosomal protein L44-domain-containing protein [Baffinella frigidus]|nr:ribosomal protein L44-domain-containing protein [Cryptophyta sp. CCMP2293]